MKIIKTIFKSALVVIIILVIVIIFPIFLYKKETNGNPLPPYYKKGVYHVHSVFSDGKGTVDEITRAADTLGLDFVILTDHGRPNRKSVKATAYLNNVLLIGGSEFSLQAGHLAAVGFKIPGYVFPPEPQEAINEIIQDKGVCFIAHPYDDRIPWTDWDVKGFSGLEILTCYRSARGIPLFKLIIFPLQYLMSSSYAVLSTLEYPQKKIKKWESLNLEAGDGHYSGIYALDAHGWMASGGKFALNFPSYRAMFKIFNIYVKVDRELPANAQQASALIISALREGNFFNVIESIAPANGFEAYFLDNAGQRVEMGGSAAVEHGKLVIRLPFEFETDILVKKDGQVYRKIIGNREKKIEVEVKGPGFYGIEVHVRNHQFKHLPWVLTNPFFIGLDKSFFGVQGRFFQKKPLVNDKGFFKVESNEGSKGSITYGKSEKNELVTTFMFKLDKDESGGKDFWSVIGARRRFDFSGYKGICFEAQSERRLRFWVEFRTGEVGGKETWYRHSFLVKKGWHEYYIPFDKFYVFFGEKKKPVLGDIRSFFFAINNAIAYSGTRGRIELKNIGLY